MGDSSETGNPESDETISELGSTSQRGDIIEDIDPATSVRAVLEDRNRPLSTHRFVLAAFLLGVVAVVAVGIGVMFLVLPADRTNGIITFAGIVFSPLVSVLATSFAWYFASQRRN
ncbi:hypothetical protein [Nocardia sp. NPDC050435]|uniref:hypothetical protein n=1 Tax=Nocardia sp. NPDC050435 TaxID=3155040 RepID=UPI0033FB97D5